MKKWITASLLSSLLTLATPLLADFDDYDIISLEDVCDDIGKAFFSGSMPLLVIECPEGTILPLRISIKGDCVSIEDDNLLFMKILHPCYVRYEHNDLLFSTDLLNWTTTSAFFSGDMHIFLGMVDDFPEVELRFDLNHNVNSLQ